MRILLALRAALFVVLLPGMVAGYIPLRMAHAHGRLRMPEASVSSLSAALLLAARVAVLLRCVWDFFAAGHGTLAPVDPPKELVVRGLYRFMRNPMYCGVLVTIAGEAWLFRHAALLGYAAAVFVTVHLFVVLYEEPSLRHRFGERYEAYRRAVPRWGLTMRPFGGG